MFESTQKSESERANTITRFQTNARQSNTNVPTLARTHVHTYKKNAVPYFCLKAKLYVLIASCNRTASVLVAIWFGCQCIGTPAIYCYACAKRHRIRNTLLRRTHSWNSRNTSDLVFSVHFVKWFCVFSLRSVDRHTFSLVPPCHVFWPCLCVFSLSHFNWQCSSLHLPFACRWKSKTKWTCKCSVIRGVRRRNVANSENSLDLL